MSAVFEAIHDGLEQLEGDPDILREMRWALDALHNCSHEHEDWLNRPLPVRVAANRLEKAIADYLKKGASNRPRCKVCGTTNHHTDSDGNIVPNPKRKDNSQ